MPKIKVLFCIFACSLFVGCSSTYFLNDVTLKAVSVPHQDFGNFEKSVHIFLFPPKIELSTETLVLNVDYYIVNRTNRTLFFRKNNNKILKISHVSFEDDTKIEYHSIPRSIYIENCNEYVALAVDHAKGMHEVSKFFGGRISARVSLKDRLENLNLISFQVCSNMTYFFMGESVVTFNEVWKTFFLKKSEEGSWIYYKNRKDGYSDKSPTCLNLL